MNIFGPIHTSKSVADALVTGLLDGSIAMEQEVNATSDQGGWTFAVHIPPGTRDRTEFVHEGESATLVPLFLSPWYEELPDSLPSSAIITALRYNPDGSIAPSAPHDSEGSVGEVGYGLFDAHGNVFRSDFRRAMRGGLWHPTESRWADLPFASELEPESIMRSCVFRMLRLTGTRRHVALCLWGDVLKLIDLIGAQYCDASEVAKCFETVVREAASPNPSRKFYRFSVQLLVDLSRQVNQEAAGRIAGMSQQLGATIWPDFVMADRSPPLVN